MSHSCKPNSTSYNTYIFSLHFIQWKSVSKRPPDSNFRSGAEIYSFSRGLSDSLNSGLKSIPIRAKNIRYAYRKFTIAENC